MIAEIIRWGLLIFLLILISLQLSRISATLILIRRLMSMLLVGTSDPETYKRSLEKVFTDMRGDD